MPAPVDGGRPLSASEVAQLQRQLRALGFKPGPADGVVGPRTIAAAREFQAAQGLPATGRIDSHLLAEATSRQYQ
jgi:localization factor PodJL